MYIFLIIGQNIDCGYLLEPPQEAVLTSTHYLCFILWVHVRIMYIPVNPNFTV